MSRIAITTAAAALLGLAPALAQDRQAPPKADQCAPSERLQQGDLKPDTPVTTGESLSEKLARTDGVLCPPEGGADMRLPTPPAGEIRVIPPPGSPGGDPTLRPK